MISDWACVFPHTAVFEICVLRVRARPAFFLTFHRKSKRGVELHGELCYIR